MNDTFQINQVEYIYPDITPKIPEINIENLKQIEQKIKEYTSGNKKIGLNQEELEQFLDWITFNARSYAVRYIPLPTEIAISTEPFSGQCAPTQNINVKVSKKIGLSIHPFNIGECIDEVGIPMSPLDIKKVQNGWFSTAVRHAVAVLLLPIQMPSGDVKECYFLLDPTFRQFCLIDENHRNLFYDDIWIKEKGYVAPRPAYFMPENLCKELIHKGYIWLSPENAKLYGDAFLKASVRIEYQNLIPNITGEEYLYYFKNCPTVLVENPATEKPYIMLPSEIDSMQKKENKLYKVLKKIIRPFSKRTSNNALPSSNLSSNDKINLRNRLHVSTDDLFAPTSNTKNTPFQENNREIS